MSKFVGNVTKRLNMEGSMIFKENCSQEGHRCQTQLCAYIILACGTKDMYQDIKQA